MKAQLVLQVPVSGVRGKGLVVAACEDPQVVRDFARLMLEATQNAIDDATDPFMREYARIRAEQLRARLQFIFEEQDQLGSEGRQAT
jgi:hypothetical protein